MCLPGFHDRLDHRRTDFGDEHQLGNFAGITGLEVNLVTHHVHLHPSLTFDPEETLGAVNAGNNGLEKGNQGILLNFLVKIQE